MRISPLDPLDISVSVIDALPLEWRELSGTFVFREDENFNLHDHIKFKRTNCLYRESSLENCLQGNLMAVLLAHALE